MPGLAGLAPMPRKRALLNFRAVNSLKNVFGESAPASLTLLTSSDVNQSADTAVMLSGRSWGFAGSFCAVTSTGGSVTRIGSWGGWAMARDAMRSSAAASDLEVVLNIKPTLPFHSGGRPEVQNHPGADRREQEADVQHWTDCGLRRV